MAVLIVVALVTVTVVVVYPEVIEYLWEEILEPALEEIFSWIGITGETVVHVSRSSVKIFGSEVGDQVEKAKVRAVVSWIKEGDAFWKHVTREVVTPTVKVEGYYKLAKNGNYIHGLPSMEVRGTNIDLDAIKTSVDIEVGGDNTVISSTSRLLPPEFNFKNELQASPTFYKPGLDTLTYDDEWGNTWTDWSWGGVVFNVDNSNYEITIKRDAELATFWVEGPESVTEGSSIEFICRSNRVVPAGTTVTVNFTYSGTLAGTQYTPIASAVMAANTDSVTVVVPILEDTISESPETLTITVDSITNMVGAFQAVAPGYKISETVNVFDNEGTILVMNSVLVNEADTSVDIPVKLTAATAGAFTVDYSFVDGSAIGGVDYDNTGGTLNFAGTEDEVQIITIPLTPDVVEGSREDFSVVLSNSSDPTVITDIQAVVTIIDTDVGHPAQSVIAYYQTIIKPNYVPYRALITQYHSTAGSVSDWYYWVYDLASAVYGSIEPTSSGAQGIEMLPVAILRSDKTSVTVDKSSEAYKSARRICLRLGIDVNDVVKGIEESEDPDGNSNLDQIDDAFINFAVDPKDDNPVVSKILWSTFEFIVVTAAIQSNSNTYTAMFKEGQVNNALAWTDHSFEADLVGVVCPVGTYLHTSTNYMVEGVDRDGNPLYHKSTIGPVLTREDKLTIQYQKTEGTYDEITVINLSSCTAIEYDGYHKVATSRLGHEEENLTIPVSYAAFKDLTHEDLLNVYNDIFRLDVYAITITDLEWYETEKFWNFMKVAGLVISIATWWMGGGSIYLLVSQIAAQYLIKQLVIYIAEATGNAKLAAIIGLVATIVVGGSFGMPAIDFATAEGLVAVVSNFANNYNAAGNQVIADIQEDTKDLLEDYEELREKTAELDTSLIDASQYVSLKSPDAILYSGIGVQYNFDAALSGNYDRLVSDFYDNLLRTDIA